MKTRKILSVLLAAAMVLTSGVFGITVHADRISGAPDYMPVLRSSGPFDDLWSAAESVGSKPVTGYRYLWNTGDDPGNFSEVNYINDEGPEHLFGGIPGFWCTTSAENYVGIHAEPHHPVTVNGIVLVTAADSGEEGCENRAPDEWVLSGINDETEEWEFLA